MQKFIQKINTHITEKLNCVRIYLWVKPLSKNSTMDRTARVTNILEGDDCHLNFTKQHYQNKTKKGQEKNNWILWKRILKTTITTTNTITYKLQRELKQLINIHRKC